MLVHYIFQDYPSDAGQQAFPHWIRSRHRVSQPDSSVAKCTLKGRSLMYYVYHILNLAEQSTGTGSIEFFENQIFSIENLGYRVLLEHILLVQSLGLGATCPFVELAGILNSESEYATSEDSDCHRFDVTLRDGLVASSTKGILHLA